MTRTREENAADLACEAAERSKPRLNEYAFDVSLSAVIRVKAASVEEAREVAASLCDAMSPTEPFIEGYNSESGKEGRAVEVTEVSLSGFDDEEENPQPFEINGEEPCVECHGPNDDGQGWNGRCGECADRSENGGN